MHSVNLDLLRATTPKADPHAHHRATHQANLRAARRQLWLDRIAHLRSLFAHSPAHAPHTCPDHQA